MNESKILKSYQLKCTEARKEILKFFEVSDHAVSQKDIEDKLSKDGINRVTIYRTLDLFTEKGIIHKVNSDEALQYFALSSKEMSTSKMHAHLKCKGCEQIKCIEIEDDQFINQFNPKYSIDRIEITVNGLCTDCKTHDYN